MTASADPTEVLVDRLVLDIRTARNLLDVTDRREQPALDVIADALLAIAHLMLAERLDRELTDARRPGRAGTRRRSAMRGDLP